METQLNARGKSLHQVAMCVLVFLCFGFFGSLSANLGLCSTRMLAVYVFGYTTGPSANN